MRGTYRVENFEMPVRLGVGAAERAEPQVVSLTWEVRDTVLPAACASDELAGTVCYDATCTELVKLVRGREFRTVEHLATVLHRQVSEAFPAGSALALTVRKPHTPVPGLRSGFSFTVHGA